MTNLVNPAPAPAAPPARRVLILGAGGRFGQAAVTAFAEAGWHVIAQARRPLGYPLPAGARVTTAALDGTSELAHVAGGGAGEAPAGVHAVVHAVNVPYPQWPQLALPLLRRSMDLACRLDARLLLPGNVYNFGAAMPAELRESTPQRPSTRLGQIRVQMEDELAGRPGLRSAVLRAGDFFGVGGGSWMDRVIVRSIARGKLVYPGPLDRCHAWAYLPDLARAFVALAERSELPAFSRWHFAGHSATGAEWLDAIEAAAAELGLRPEAGLLRRGLPWGVLRLGGWLLPSWRALTELAYLWSVPHRLEGEALLALLGPLPTTPLVIALRQTLLALGHHPTPAALPALS
jgi:nucleoside-diphosphate-sugar epimerase